MIAIDSVDGLQLFLSIALCLAFFGALVSFVKKRSGLGVVGDLGVVYCSFLVAYTVQPALVLLFGVGAEDQPLLQLDFPTDEFVRHFWRHTLYIFGFVIGYLTLRGRVQLPSRIDLARAISSRKIMYVFMVFLAIGILYIYSVSAPIETYYDHYVRFDHLDWLSKKLASGFVRLKLGVYSVCLVILFCYERKNPRLIIAFVGVVCIYELIYSYGSRIQVLIFLLQVVCLYHFTVRPVSLPRVLSVLAALVLGFSVVEVVRLASFGEGAVELVFSDFQLRPPAELGSVFYPGVFLYRQRDLGILPEAALPMYFYEFLSIFTFGDFLDWSPMEWFRLNYHPEAVVPPWTLGPIADSAVWGGEADLFFHSLVNGLFFGGVTRWFARNSGKLWVVVIYVFIYGGCILTFKYSVFYIVNPIVKNLLPVLLMFWLFNQFLSASKVQSKRE